LIDHADCRLRLIAASMKQTQKLALFVPIPTNIVYRFKSFFLNLGRQLREIWKKVSVGRSLLSKRPIDWDAQNANPGKDFQPWQKYPKRRNDQPDNPAVRRQISNKE